MERHVLMSMPSLLSRSTFAGMDPDLLAALQDPVVMAALQDIMANPSNAMKYMSNPKIGPIIQKSMF